YHTKNRQGTTTRSSTRRRAMPLYHTKNRQGTTTPNFAPVNQPYIIPYQEPSGNYNSESQKFIFRRIIPYQEPSGNYNIELNKVEPKPIIPYQEPSGNYNSQANKPAIAHDY